MRASILLNAAQKCFSVQQSKRCWTVVSGVWNACFRSCFKLCFLCGSYVILHVFSYSCMCFAYNIMWLNFLVCWFYNVCVFVLPCLWWVGYFCVCCLHVTEYDGESVLPSLCLEVVIFCTRKLCCVWVFIVWHNATLVVGYTLFSYMIS